MSKKFSLDSSENAYIMLLIDALYINNSGGLRLLEYLIASLNVRGEDYYLLADARCRGKFDECKNVMYLKATLLERNKFYSTESSRFSMVLCFGNIPAPKKMLIPVYTYFHNINLLTLRELPTIKAKMKGWLKRAVFRHYKRNTDMWLVQTQNTKVELEKHLNEDGRRVRLMPFFELPMSLDKISKETRGGDYVYVANYTGSKQHETLLEAWRILHRRGVDARLHLTVPNTETRYIEKVQKAQLEGVKIINHGFVSFEEVIKLYGQSKAIVYPSLNESLGLGLVEAITAGCDVIGADLPYTYAVCKPSKVFDPYSAESIADAIIAYEKDGAVKSELVIHNMIVELVDMLTETKSKTTMTLMGGGNI